MTDRAGEPQLVQFQSHCQRAPDALRQLVQPLCVLLQDQSRVAALDAAGQLIEQPLVLRDAPAGGLGRPVRERGDGPDPLRAVRNDDLGRRRGRWRPSVCDEIREREIDLVPHGRYDRDLAGEDCPCDTFLVESPQVLQ